MRGLWHFLLEVQGLCNNNKVHGSNIQSHRSAYMFRTCLAAARMHKPAKCIDIWGMLLATILSPKVVEADRERERELRREGGKSLLAYVKGAGPYLI